MNTKRAALYIGVMFLAALAYALAVYPSLPDRIPIHWNIRGEVDGWGPKTMVFFGPGMVLLGLAMLRFLPAVSPAKFKIEPFLPTFNAVMVLVSGLFTFIAWMTIHAARHPDAAVGRELVAGICVFLAAVGSLMRGVKRNFYMGVRTPWTLASDKVWNATHCVAARWMTAGGLIAATLTVLGAPMALAIGVLIGTALYPVLFSFLYYKHLEASGGL